jgi:hypothetical protein
MPPAPGVARVLVASRNPGGTVQFLALPRPSRATARPDKVARQSILASPDLGVCHGQRTMAAYPKVFRVKDLKRRTSAIRGVGCHWTSPAAKARRSDLSSSVFNASSTTQLHGSPPLRRMLAAKRCPK